MHIIQIGSYPINPDFIKGGIEASVYGLANELTITHKVTVIDIPRTENQKDFTETTDLLTVLRFKSYGNNNNASILRIYAILKWIKSNGADICHLHSTSLFSFFLFLALKVYRIPVLITVHGLAHIEKKNEWRKKPNFRNWLKYLVQSITEFLIISCCRVLIVDTKYVAESIEKYKKQGKIFRLPVCKIIPQGINSVYFELENCPVKHQILSIGALNKRKGHLILIDALLKVKEVFPEVRLIIAGAMANPSYFHQMQLKIEQYSLESNIQIYPDASFEMIKEFYASSELFVLHSEEESQGIVLCEALAAGKPIISTNVGGIPWVVEPGKNGLLSDFGDIDAFAYNIISLLSDSELRTDMTVNNKKKSHNYNWKTISTTIQELYSTILKN